MESLSPSEKIRFVHCAYKRRAVSLLRTLYKRLPCRSHGINLKVVQ